MRVRIFTIILALMFGLAFTIMAQETETPTVFEVQLTATQLVFEATETALANTGEVELASTDDPFQMTATALIVHATQTGVASGASPAPATGEVSNDEFQLTATQLVLDATATAENSVISQVTTDNSGNSPFGLTVIAFGLVIFLLIAFGGFYLFIANRAEDKQKLG